MTTESKQVIRPHGVPVLLGAAVSGLVAAVLLTLVGAVAADSAAAYGALTGGATTLVVFALGSFSVDLVARAMPGLSLLVALLTYTLQVVALAMVFAGLDGSGLLDDTLDRGWLAAGVVAVTLVWLLAQVWLTTRARIPVYDLPSSPASSHLGERPEAGAR
jgi:hypothetical protein